MRSVNFGGRGDEMNSHMPQDDISETELRHIAAIKHNIISPATGKPIVGIFQDSLVGSTSITRQGINFDAKHAMNLLVNKDYLDLSQFNGDIYQRFTNFELLSNIMPPISLKKKTTAYEAYENPEMAKANGEMHIVNGRYIKGQLVKKGLDGASHGLLHRIYRDCGKDACVTFMDDLQFIVNEYMKTAGYSVGISDLIWNPETQKKVEEVIQENKENVMELINQTHLGIFKNETNNTNQQQLENEIMGKLNQSTSKVGKIVQQTLGVDNRFVFMSGFLSGSKGSHTNISQMIALLGQQTINSGRIPYGYDNRSLPHFKKYDDSPESRGFIENSFISGLEPHELFFHAIAGRIGLIDTAVKSVTWDTPIVLIENSHCIYTEIGKWIDKKLDDENNVVERHKERNLELLRIPDGVYIPTTDYQGNVTWGACTAVTRHDPGEKLYAIRTLGGREVTVTESKSLLVWNQETRELQEIEPFNIKVGDKLPVTQTLCEPPVLQEYIEQDGKQVKLNKENGALFGSQCGDEIPSEYFIAPTDFIIGFLSSVDTKHISTKRKAEGINMLYTRIGIYTRVAQKEHNNWYITIEHSDNVNDIALDAVTNIEELGVEAHPKMYDLTIPSTLNFGLANGLQVRDTSETGYIQRRLIKAMEDIKIEWDMTVRNHKGKIVQFVYGGDSFDTTAIESQKIAFMEMSVEEIYKHFYFADGNDAKEDRNILKSAYTKEAFSRLSKQKDEYRVQIGEIIEEILKQRPLIATNVMQELFNDDAMSVNMPVHFDYAITYIINQTGITQSTMLDITPLEVLNKLKNCYDELAGRGYTMPSKLFKLLYFHYLSPKKLLLKHHINSITLDVLLEYVKLTYKRALIQPGEMVGIVSAQSVGEPTTQMTLNTFHNAGVAEKTNVTTGLPRLQEILKITETPAKPAMVVYMLGKDSETTKQQVSRIMKEIEYVTLQDIVANISIYYDPKENDTVVKEDEVLIRQYSEFLRVAEECAGLPPQQEQPNLWVMRLKMDPHKMLAKNITMDDVYYVIKHGYGDFITCVYADNNDSNLVFRLKVDVATRGRRKTKSLPLNASDEIHLLKSFSETLMTATVLKGMRKVKKATTRVIKDAVDCVDGKYSAKEIWVLDTVGSNLKAMLANIDIDATRTISNDITEVKNVLGIEAARQVIMNEMAETFRTSGALQYHHMCLLVDRMTYNKKPVQIYRHGILSDDIGPIAKASFEQTPQNFLEAAMFGMLDEVRGVSANVMCGQEGIYGTNMSQVLLDMEKLHSLSVEKLLEKKPIEEEILKEFDGLETNEVCSKKELTVHSAFNDIKQKEVVLDDDHDIEL